MSAVTSFGRVAQAVVDALKATPALAGGNVKANPTRPWEREVPACIAVRLVGAQKVEGFNCGETWALTLSAECEARRTSTAAEPSDAADALLNAVATRLAVLDLSALGVIERTQDDAIDWEFDATEHAAAMVSLRFGYHVNVTDTYTVPTP
jgi:hypothetical protein